MSSRNDTEMPEAHDSSGLPDDTPSETISTVDRPRGSALRQRRLPEIHESVADYADLFRALQIRPESYERFLNGVLKVVRQKNIKELQSGTDAKIKQLSRLVLRGYRTLVWNEGSCWQMENGELGANWLLDAEELEQGEERLLHGGDNERFYPLLEPIWWRMRELVFEPKALPKGYAGRKKNAREAGGVESAYEADNDTEIDIRPSHDRTRDPQTLRKLAKLVSDAPGPRRRYLSADETDQAIVDLVVRLADARARSDPEIFRRLWDQHVGRLDELESCHHGFEQSDAIVARTPAAVVGPAEGLAVTGNAPGSTAVAAPKLNLSNEPFATAGNPIPQPWPHTVPAQVPAAMAVYISAAPPESPYTRQAYEWLDAPVRMVDQTAFYAGLMRRVKMQAGQVKGLATSYGWCDVARWVAWGAAGQRDGWNMLQSDLAWAAGRGVRVWRMKVLVVGEPVVNG